jgi:ABC-type Zn2+ transport system substrate-binding protein/surface adhesin
MHIHHDHVAGGCHDHEHNHTHSHEHTHDHTHCHEHSHDHSHDCGGHCHSCQGSCEHTPMEELTALMKYMVSHNASHARELAELAQKIDKTGNHTAYEQVMAAVSDFEKGNMRLSVVLASLEVK